MGLTNGYGLVIGPKSNYFRDPPDNFGRYYHGNVIIHTPAGEYHCAIDVDPKFMPDGVQWRVVNIRAQDFAAFKALPDGWHALQSTAASGAMDYIRSRVLHPPILFWNVRYSSCFSSLLNFFRWNPPWTSGTGIQALTDLEGLIAQSARFYIFGEPFSTGLGVHNIHQNQGDPAGRRPRRRKRHLAGWRDYRRNDARQIRRLPQQVQDPVLQNRQPRAPYMIKYGGRAPMPSVPLPGRLRPR